LTGVVALRWSSVLAARGGVERDADQAFLKLLKAFQPSIAAYLGRAAPSANPDEIARELFASLAKRRVEVSNHPLRGRFRLFLRTALAEYLRDHSKPDRNARSTASAERAFDSAWAQVLIERALAQLETECTSSEPPQPVPFSDLKAFLTSTPPASEYARVAAELKMPTNSLSVIVQRTRQRLAELLQVQVGDTLLDQSLLGPEFNALRGSFLGSGA
jgi:hypothetical protein